MRDGSSNHMRLGLGAAMLVALGAACGGMSDDDILGRRANVSSTNTNSPEPIQDTAPQTPPPPSSGTTDSGAPSPSVDAGTDAGADAGADAA